MANLLDKLLNLMGIEDGEPEDDYTTYDRYSERPARPVLRATSEPKVSRGRLISFPGKSDQEGGLTKIALCELCDFDEVPEVVNNLQSDVPVVINLRRSAPPMAQRILDFLCGVIFAIDGRIAKVEEAIYLLTPKGVNISADFDLLSLDPELDWLNK